MGMLKYRYNNFYEMLYENAKKSGSKTALFQGDDKVSYKQLLSMCDRLAGYLHEEGIKSSERVAIFMRNSIEFVVSVFAISKIGAVVVPINTFLKSDELAYILKDSQAVALFASSNFEKVVHDAGADKLCKKIIWEGGLRLSSDIHIPFDDAMANDIKYPPVMRKLDDMAVIFYTSGTTGRPKGAMLSYKNIFSNAASAEILFRLSAKDRDIVFLPMFHSFTFSIGVILPIYVGASIVIIQSVRPFSNIFKQVLLKRVTIFMGIPDVYNALVKAKLPWYFMWFNNIRLFVSGASALRPATLEAMKSRFKRAKMLEGYGLSESSPAVCINPLDRQKAGSVGPAMPGFEIKIVDDELNELPRGEIGDIIVHGDNVMIGYLNRPEATEETIINGWLLTGDMGYMDEDGYLYIVDRKKDLIISKGINIYPREIEETIESFEGVAMSAVIGIPDENSGEIPVAYIETEDGKEIDIKELKRYLKAKLANYKIPKHIHIIDELPKNATGKVLKRVLKERLAQK